MASEETQSKTEKRPQLKVLRKIPDFDICDEFSNKTVHFSLFLGFVAGVVGNPADMVLTRYVLRTYLLRFAWYIEYHGFFNISYSYSCVVFLLCFEI